MASSSPRGAQGSVSPESARKRQLLEQLLRERSLASGTPPADVASRPEAPLSSAQSRIWFFEQVRPGTSMFNLPVVLGLTGQLDVGALERAIDALVGRHAVLRTVIAVREGTPVQVILPRIDPVRLDAIDLGGLPESDRSREAERLASTSFGEPFDLARGPLFRAGIVRQSAAEHTFVLRMHHLICDGWSVQLLVRELAALYAGEVTGTAVQLPALRVQYADLARREQQALASGAFQPDLDYWRERLAGAPETTELPADSPRGTVQVAAGASEIRVIDGALRDRVRRLAREHQCTLFMTLLAAFKCLLARLTGQTELVIGCPVMGRSAEAEALVGCFVNHVALRTDLAGDPSFSEALHRVRETALGAYAHQDVPFDKVVEHVQPHREPGRPPLFQIQFNMTFAACERLELPGLVAEPKFTEEDWSRFDLGVFFVEFHDRMDWWVVYNSELYTRSTVRSLMERFERLLAQSTEDPHRPLSAYSLVTEAEQRSLIGAFSGPLE